MINTMNVQELLNQTVTLLQQSGLNNARNEAEIIFAETLKMPRLELYLASARMLSPREEKRLISRVERRSMLHEPLQYILGQAAFRELNLRVGPGVLVPRPETELLAEYVIRHAPSGATICDVGVGSGAIALSLAFERPDTKVTGVDISEQALKYARYNRARYNLKNVRLMHSNLFARMPKAQFDVVTANLPYVTEEEMNALASEVRDHEPELALNGGGDGLSVIRRLIAQLPRHLKPNGFVIFELGIRQAEEVCRMCREANIFAAPEILNDYNGHQRFVLAKRVAQKS